MCEYFLWRTKRRTKTMNFQLKTIYRDCKFNFYIEIPFRKCILPVYFVMSSCVVIRIIYKWRKERLLGETNLLNDYRKFIFCVIKTLIRLKNCFPNVVWFNKLHWTKFQVFSPRHPYKQDQLTTSVRVQKNSYA